TTRTTTTTTTTQPPPSPVGGRCSGRSEHRALACRRQTIVQDRPPPSDEAPAPYHRIVTMTDLTPPHPHIPPFRGRQRVSDSPIPRFNPRAAKFYAIRSRLPPLTSRAACARYRLSRKTAIPLHDIAAAEHLLIQLNDIATLLHDVLLALPPAVIHTPDRASSSCCDPAPSAHSCDRPPCTPPFWNTPQHCLTLPPSPYAPLDNFLADDCITGHMVLRSHETTRRGSLL
ncbi:hypothetical protein B0H13DRAFT_635304, partial [Mycena leptocephala]